jgi:parvulin-like peptidyl-prolyl isomerase
LTPPQGYGNFGGEHLQATRNPIEEEKAVRLYLALILMALLVLGCAESKEPEQAEKLQPAPPGQIRASHILVSYEGVAGMDATRSKVEARELAEEILERVRSGESFATLAETYSDCPTAAKQGDLGFFGKGRMVKPFEDAAFALNKDEVSDVVETKFGYHLIKRTQ